MDLGGLCKEFQGGVGSSTRGHWWQIILTIYVPIDVRPQTNKQDWAHVSFARQTAPRLIWSFRAKTHDEASRGFGLREIGSRETGQLCVVRYPFYVSPRAVVHIQIFLFMCLWWSVWISCLASHMVNFLDCSFSKAKVTWQWVFDVIEFLRSYFQSICWQSSRYIFKLERLETLQIFPKMNHFVQF